MNARVVGGLIIAALGVIISIISLRILVDSLSLLGVSPAAMPLVVLVMGSLVMLPILVVVRWGIERK